MEAMEAKGLKVRSSLKEGVFERHRSLKEELIEWAMAWPRLQTPAQVFLWHLSQSNGSWVDWAKSSLPPLSLSMNSKEGALVA